MKRNGSKGFSVVGITVMVAVISVFMFFAAPLFERWSIRNESALFVSMLNKASEDAELYYQANCSSSGLSPSLNDLRDAGLLRFRSDLRSPWGGDEPELYYSGWGTSTARVQLVVPSTPTKYLAALKGQSSYISVSGDTVIFDRSIGFGYDEEQQALIQRRNLFDDSGC